MKKSFWCNSFCEMSTVLNSTGINLGTKESTFKFPLLPIGGANLKFPVK